MSNTMNHYAELTKVPFIGGGSITLCLEDISLLQDFGSDGTGIRLRDGYETECTEPYATVKALLLEAASPTHTHHRYQIIEKSLSSHCCFQYTIIDTSQHLFLKTISQEEFNSYPLDSTLFPLEKDGHINLYYKNKFHTICECFNLEEATLVCNALNT